MAYIIIIIISILFYDSQAKKLNKMRAEIYCIYRLWSNDKNDQSNTWFLREMVLIVRDQREGMEDRYKWLSSRWLKVSEEEKDAFIESSQRKVFE